MTTAVEILEQIQAYNAYERTITVQIYTALKKLVQDSDSFYVTQFPAAPNTKYEVFSYRLGSYSEFMLPGAIEARGIMFEVNDHGTPLRIASRPMEKFWNVGENPMVMDLDWSQVQHSFIKEDGSLISTFSERLVGMGEDFETQVEYRLRVKSKTSINSDQAKAALAYIETTPELKVGMTKLEARGYTVNCEWTSPDNRIVVGYLEPKLVVLNARNRITGEYLGREELEIYFPTHIVGLGDTIVVEADVQALRAHTGYEGVILQFAAGYKVNFVKLKNDWYLHRHKTKDSVNNVNHLFDAVLHEAVDDLKTLFLEDPLAMRRIDEMEALVVPLYNGFVSTVETWYEAHKHLDRKDFAVKAQSEFPQAHSPLNKITFSAMMSLYQGKPPHFKELLSKHKKSFITMVDVETD